MIMTMIMTLKSPKEIWEQEDSRYEIFELDKGVQDAKNERIRDD